MSDFAKKKAEEVANNILLESPNYKGQTIKVIMQAQIKSILGSIVSFEFSYITVDRFTPNVNTRWITINFAGDSVFEDLNKSIYKFLELNDYDEIKLPITLRNYFSDKETLAALLNNSNVNYFITTKVKNIPNSVNEILSMRSMEVGRNNNDKLFFEEESLSNFVFDRVTDKQLITRLQVFPNTSKVYEISSIEIKLPLNEQIIEFLSSPNTLLSENRPDSFINTQSNIVTESKIGG